MSHLPNIYNSYYFVKKLTQVTGVHDKVKYGTGPTGASGRA